MLLAKLNVVKMAFRHFGVKRYSWFVLLDMSCLFRLLYFHLHISFPLSPPSPAFRKSFSNSFYFLPPTYKQFTECIE